MPPVCIAPTSIGSVGGVASSPWSTLWVCALSSSLTVQQTSSDQNRSAPTTLTAGQSARTKAVIDNPALSDWFFYHRVMESLELLTYSLRLEWQHRDSHHMHGLAWLPGTPDVEQFLHDDNDSLKEIIIQQADQLLSTVNPAVHTDGSNVADALPPKIDPHIWNKVYGDVNDLASNWHE